MKKFTAYFTNHPPIYFEAQTVKEARIKAKKLAKSQNIKLIDIGDRYN